VLDETDETGLKNAYTDLVERVQLGRALGRRPLRVAVDLGCGQGRLSGLLARRADRVVALDACLPMLLAARRGILENISPVRADLRQIPLRDGSVDLVLTANVLIHLVEDADLDKTAAEIARVLAPGGRTLLLEHAAAAGTFRREGIVYRSPPDMARAFERAGLHALSSSPIRKMPSRFVHWARRGYLPRVLWPLAARIEPLHAVVGSVEPDYRDQLLVLARPAGPRHDRPSH
jgi:ubiquinone/menaquinone biosynthesis C-methylase UbiE